MNKTFEQRKKEEFEKKFLHGLKFHKSLAFDEIALERLMADELWSFISQSLSDYKKELVEEILGFFKDGHNLTFTAGQLKSYLSLLQKDKENNSHE